FSIKKQIGYFIVSFINVFIKVDLVIFIYPGGEIADINRNFLFQRIGAFFSCMHGCIDFFRRPFFIVFQYFYGKISCLAYSDTSVTSGSILSAKKAFRRAVM